MIKGLWWKFTGLGLILYSIVAGQLVEVPDKPLIRDTIRNLFFHVPMWFSMFVMFGTSLVYSLKYLKGNKLSYDIEASESVYNGIFFGVIGLITGMIWAKFTWGDFWTNDPQLNGAAVSMMAYLAYAILRSSIDEKSMRARISAVYNIFAFMLLAIFLGVLPRLAQGSLHPGKGGNPSTMEDLDITLRLVFYPAVIGWIIVAFWVLQIRARKRRLLQSVNQIND
jgi:heme exporter protein C